jgi:TolB protein
MEKRMLVLFFVFSMMATVLAKPIIRVEGARFRPLQIALPEFSFQQNSDSAQVKIIASQITSSIRQYLELSGVFSILDPKSYLVDPKKEFLNRSSIKMQQWSDIGAEGLVKGHVQVVAGKLYVDLAIHQVGIALDSEQKKYMTTPQDIKKLALKVSDDIYRYFTGEDGPFLSQIVAGKSLPSGKQLMIMDLGGENQRQVTKKSNLNLLPTLTPEGDRILFTSYLKKNPDLFSVRTDGTDLKVLSSYPGLNLGASISPDKSKIAITLSRDGDSEIYLMDRSGRNLQRLTNSRGIDTSPSWSADGKQIAFVSERSGNPQIYLMNADGSHPQRLTFQGKYNQTPRFGPRGDYIVFTGRDERMVFDIFLYDLKTKKISRVTQEQGNNEEPSFAPNGRLIVFTSTRNGLRDLYLSNLDGTFQKRLTDDGRYWTPSFGPLP